MGNCEKDIDDLLEEFEQSLLKCVELEIENRIQFNYSPENKSASIDLDDILKIDLDENTIIPVEADGPSSSDILKQIVTKKHTRCTQPMIGGPTLEYGVSTTNINRICSELHCTSCEFKVKVFENYKWQNTMDYIFLRLNYPDFQKLLAYLDTSLGWNAFACQCCYESTNVNKLVDGRTTWFCKGHKFV